MATPETRRQLLAAVAACDDKKGEDTRILELDPADSGLADFFLITSATNDRQVVAIADEIEFRLKKDFGLYATSVEGRRQAEWILLDYVDIVIHVFLQEKRAFYDIERLRKSARPLTSAEVEAELKAELAQKTRAVRGTTASPSKKATKATTGKSPATRAQKPKSPSANTVPSGDSTVTAKPAKKAAKKSTAKPAAKPAKKAAASPATILGANTALVSKSAAVSEGPGVMGAKPPIVKRAMPPAPVATASTRKTKPSVGKEPLPPPPPPPPPPTKGAQPPIVKRAIPATPIDVAASAAPAPKKAAKKAAKKTAKKAPLK